MLSNKIWVTRKTRIYTEQRLVKKNQRSQLFIIIYSSCLVFLTVWNLKYPTSNIEILLVIGSIAVLVASVTVSSQNFLERALAMRNCYIKLDELYSKVVRAEKASDDDAIQQLESEYTANLLNVENHIDYDYLCLRFSLRENKKTTLPSFTKTDFCDYLIEKGWRILLNFTVIILPVCAYIAWKVYC